MPSSKQHITLLIGCLALANAMPQGNQDKGTPLFELPFLQFKDGGIRLNFGGYHAEAGLGGLLTGSRTGGGLHASAGTPWGAHAGAGLGGDLGGNDATAGGGLYARAGLGRGRPEAAAGLGGKLDGSGRSAAPVTGGLYAGATLGEDLLNAGSAGASGGANAGANAGAQASASAGANQPASRSSIQIISRSGKRSEKIQQKAERAAGDEFPNDTKYKEVQGQVVVPALSAEAGLFGAVFGNGAVQTVKVKNGDVEQIDSVPVAPYVPAGDSGTTGGGQPWTFTPTIPAPYWAVDYLPAKSQPVISSRNGDFIYVLPDVDVKVYRKVGRPRWHIKKRFWSTAPRKQLIYYSDGEGDPEPKTTS